MYRFFQRIVIVLLLCCCKYSFNAQELPPITIFTTEDYNAENQNWAISQSETNFIYVANNLGLLEFNGARWQLYQTPNNTIMRSVRAYKDKVFTGFYMDFGFWKKNKFGALEYTSIVKNEQIQMLDDEQIWSILEVDGWLLFKSLQRIYLYNLESKEVNIINAENRIYKLSNTKSGIYFQEVNKGIFKIENGAPKLISEDPIFKENIIVEIFEKENQLLFLTQKEGFYFMKGKKPVKWKLPSKILENKTIYSAIQLKDKSFLLGTISNGLINLNEDGSIDYLVDKNSGISNNTILSVFEDRENNIWLGLDNGINCINNSSPFKINNEKSHYLGTIYTTIVHNQNLLSWNQSRAVL